MLKCVTLWWNSIHHQHHTRVVRTFRLHMSSNWVLSSRARDNGREVGERDVIDTAYWKLHHGHQTVHHCCVVLMRFLRFHLPLLPSILLPTTGIECRLCSVAVRRYLLVLFHLIYSTYVETLQRNVGCYSFTNEH